MNKEAIEMFFFSMQIPGFVKKEIEKLEEVITPFMKKANRLSFWSFPLIAISLFQLLFLLFITPESAHMLTLGLYAAIGAAGFALAKEAKIQRKDRVNQSTEYM